MTAFSTTLHKIFQFPLTRIIIGLVACLSMQILVQLTLNHYLEAFIPDKRLLDLTRAILDSVVVLFTYYYLFHFYEKREITELSTRQLGKNLIGGIFVGFMMLTLVVAIIWIFGTYKVVKTNGILSFIPTFSMALSSGIIEEILMRGIIFRIVEEKLGSYIAILISGLIFGFAHISNPNSSIFAAIAITVEAGFMLALAYVLTRNLWFPIAIHFAWNFTQAAIYGANVSGNAIGDTYVVSEIHGNSLITGGDFGPEASIQAIICGLIVAGIFLWYSRKRGNIILPFWKNSKTVVQ